MGSQKWDPSCIITVLSKYGLSNLLIRVKSGVECSGETHAIIRLITSFSEEPGLMAWVAQYYLSEG